MRRRICRGLISPSRQDALLANNLCSKRRRCAYHKGCFYHPGEGTTAVSRVATVASTSILLSGITDRPEASCFAETKVGGPSLACGRAWLYWMRLVDGEVEGDGRV